MIEDLVSDDRLQRCQDMLGHQFRSLELLEQSLTHTSASSTRAGSNERLEFMGDAVLGLVVTQDIFVAFPHLPEGELTKIKSSVVSRDTCARIANELGLSELLRLGKGVSSSSSLPSSLAAGVFEAVIAALYLDGGLEPSRQFILRTVGPFIQAATASRHQRNYKSLLQHHAQKEWNATPVYDLLDEKGPEHAKCFELAVRIRGTQYPSAWGSTKKDAEQKAAFMALSELNLLDAAEIAADFVPEE